MIVIGNVGLSGISRIKALGSVSRGSYSDMVRYSYGLFIHKIAVRLDLSDCKDIQMLNSGLSLSLSLLYKNIIGFSLN